MATRPRSRTLPMVLVGLVLALTPIGCRDGSDNTESTRSEGLKGKIGALRVSAQNEAGYDRDRFGPYDRDQVLAANQRAYPGCGGYYSAADDQCHQSAEDVQIDHIVALSEAWSSGARTWSDDRREKFAADPANLAPLTAELNMSKGDADPSEWLPPHKPYRCEYLNTYVAVKTTYDLAVDQDEQRALLRVARGCASSQR